MSDARTKNPDAQQKRKVLFVCVENACRSQMAEMFVILLAGNLKATSAGSKPAAVVNPKVLESMRRKFVIDWPVGKPKGLSEVPSAGWDYVITMGCGDACPFVPAVRREDWKIPDPKAMGPAEFDAVRDLIEMKVRALLDEL